MKGANKQGHGICFPICSSSRDLSGSRRFPTRSGFCSSWFLFIYINVTFLSTTATEFPFQRFRCQNIDFSFIQIVFHFFLLISSYLGTRKRINLGLGSSWFALLIRSRISGVRNIIQFEPIQSSSEWKEPKLTSGGNFGHSLAYIKKFEDLT